MDEEELVIFDLLTTSDPNAPMRRSRKSNGCRDLCWRSHTILTGAID